MKRDVRNISRSKKKEVFCGSVKEAEIKDHEYWQMISYSQKIGVITYLRECFYGKKATTGRIRRFHKAAK